MTGSVLVDTSVWVGHLRSGSQPLAALLTGEQVLAHPMVIGELACGQLQRRREILTWLAELPGASVATHTEVLQLIDNHALMGRGIGYNDAHLLAATVLSAPARLWTLDRRLGALAEHLGVAFIPTGETDTDRP